MKKFVFVLLTVGVLFSACAKYYEYVAVSPVSAETATPENPQQWIYWHTYKGKMYYIVGEADESDSSSQIRFCNQIPKVLHGTEDGLVLNASARGNDLLVGKLDDNGSFVPIPEDAQERQEGGTPVCGGLYKKQNDKYTPVKRLENIKENDALSILYLCQKAGGIRYPKAGFHDLEKVTKRRLDREERKSPKGPSFCAE